MRLSFVIPVLDEARHLPAHLAQYESLNGRFHFEVIVSDGGSSDASQEIVRRSPARLVQADAPLTIGANRNAGAAVASGDLLVFCDADTLFEDLASFCKTIVSVFENAETVGAMPWIGVFPWERKRFDRVYHWFYNQVIRLSFLTPFALGSGQCQVVRRSAFEAIGGYPAQRVHGEDAGLFHALGRRGRLVFLRRHRLWESPRRYRHFGYPRFFAQALYSLIGQKVVGGNVLREWRRVD